MGIKQPDREDCIEKWVNVKAWNLDIDSAILAEMDIDPMEKASEFNENPDVHRHTILFEPHDDEQYDMLWLPNRRIVVPRSKWTPKVSL